MDIMKIQYSKKNKKHFVIPLLVMLLTTMSGCIFSDLKDDLAEYEKHFGLSGKVLGNSQSTDPIIIILYQHKNNSPIPVQYLIADANRKFSFIVASGSFSIAAFEDLNNNLTWDEGELFGFYGNPDTIMVDPEEITSKGTKSISLLDIELKASTGYPNEFPRFIDKANFAEGLRRLGVITTLDDAIFAQENGSLGFWKPFSFLQTLGAGIYFLEEYDPDKIPVLFVHGAVGTPIGWKPIVAKLDQKRYQPWFFYYPSGLRLDPIANALNSYVQELHQEYGFKTLHVISHSMGGLVSRAFILKNVLETKQSYIDTFISMSTPWGGVSTAAMGVEKAPAVVPNWHDVSPGSDFLHTIYDTQFPNNVKFHLLFGVRGESSILMGNNDGTVEIASEIDHRAQADAAGFYGFDEDHGTILTSERVLDLLVEILDNSDR